MKKFMKNALCRLLVVAMLAGTVAVGNSFVGAKTSLAADATEAKTLVNQASTVKSDSGEGLEQGRTIVFDHPVYTATFVIKSVTSSEVVVDLDVTAKDQEMKDRGYMWGDAEVSGYDELKFNSGSVPLDIRKDRTETTKYYEAKIKVSKIKDGSNYFDFVIRPSLRYDTETIEGKSTNKVEFTYLDPTSISKYGTTFNVTTNSVSFGKAVEGEGCGTVVYYRKKGDPEWIEKKFENGSSIKITGLTASTRYEFKGANYTTKDGVETIGTECEPFFVNTASNAPAIKSVKATGVKQFQVTIPGEWRNHKWYPAHKVWKTKFKLSITFKKAPQNVTSMWFAVNKAHLDIKAKKKVSKSVTLGGKLKGKKLTVSVYSYSEVYQKGKSKVAKKKVKL